MGISAIVLVVLLIIIAIFFKRPISDAAEYASDEISIKCLKSSKRLVTERLEMEDWLKKQNRQPLTIEELKTLLNMHSPVQK